MRTSLNHENEEEEDNDEESVIRVKDNKDVVAES
jgi:hypothetical protein